MKENELSPNGKRVGPDGRPVLSNVGEVLVTPQEEAQKRAMQELWDKAQGSSPNPVAAQALGQIQAQRGGGPVDYYGRNQAWVLPGEHVYNTVLSPDQEAAFRQWVLANKAPFQPDERVSDYDMRGFWSALQSGDPRARSAIDPNDRRLHYPDYWKTPYHQSFSNESQWADPAKAPRWNERDQLVLPDGTVLYDDRAPKGGER